MDWVNMWEFLSGQGIMFWSAAVAVALGITLILTAVHLQWRRRQAARIAGIQASVFPEPSFDATNEGTSPSSGAIDSAHRGDRSTPDQAEMWDLVARLRVAADRLAEIQASSRTHPSIFDDSHLKDDRNEVEYLFRAGKG